MDVAVGEAEGWRMVHTGCRRKGRGFAGRPTRERDAGCLYLGAWAARKSLAIQTLAPTLPLLKRW